jgi:hypothetical protein
MTMIMAVISQDGIIVAADTRCMIGRSGNYIGYHDNARKIIMSPEDSECKMACAFSVTSWGGYTDLPSTIGHNNKKRPLRDIHSDIEYRFKNINEEWPIAGSSVTNICAKYSDGIQEISIGNLKDRIRVNDKGFFCSRSIDDGRTEGDDSFSSIAAAILFVKEQIRKASKEKVTIGPYVDIVLVTNSSVEWLEGEDRIIYPTKKKELALLYKYREPKIVLLTDGHTFQKELDDC